MKSAVLFAAIAVALPVPANAAPAYLNCEFPGGDSTPFVVSVTADEQAGTVALFMPSTGNREQLVGTFTPDRLLFGNRMMSYAINRINLSIVRTVPMIRSTEGGQCKVQPTPKRAF